MILCYDCIGYILFYIYDIKLIMTIMTLIDKNLIYYKYIRQLKHITFTIKWIPVRKYYFVYKLILDKNFHRGTSYEIIEKFPNLDTLIIQPSHHNYTITTIPEINSYLLFNTHIPKNYIFKIKSYYGHHDINMLKLYKKILNIRHIKYTTINIIYSSTSHANNTYILKNTDKDLYLKLNRLYDINLLNIIDNIIINSRTTLKHLTYSPMLDPWFT